MTGSEVARMDAGDRHRELIMDGNLASAGRPDKYGGIDQTRDDWVATPVTPEPFTVTWTLSAPHQTLYYDIYILLKQIGLQTNHLHGIV